MEATRDLGCADLWQASLERSLARRGKSRRSSIELHRLRPARDLIQGEVLSESAAYWKLRRAAARHSPLLVPAATGVSIAAVLAATVPKLLGGSGAAAGHAERLASLAGAAGTGSALHASALTPPSAAAAQIPSPARPVRHPVAARPGAVPTQPAVEHPVLAAQRPAAPAPHAVLATRTPALPARGADRFARSAAAHASRSASATHAIAARTHVRAPAAHRSAPAHAVSTPTRPHAASKPAGHTVTTSPAVPKPAPQPQPVVVATGQYVNPLAGAQVTPERIDQGVDYAGSGTLGALGAGKVIYVGTSNTGWPGAFIEYQLEGGPDAGRYVYYAEGVSPAAGLHVGQQLQAGQAVAQITPGSSSGIEIGWAAGVGTETYAAAAEGWGSAQDAANMASPAGKNFSALVASLGGPPGIVEG